jgi:hypothetical protein
MTRISLLSKVMGMCEYFDATYVGETPTWLTLRKYSVRCLLLIGWDEPPDMASTSLYEVLRLLICLDSCFGGGSGNTSLGCG